MHRVVMGVKDSDIQVDHIDHNGLNNQKYNLRLCTLVQNSHNQRKRARVCSSKFKGVNSSHEGKWEARIRVGNGKRIRLGTFTTEIEAAEAYKSAAETLHGEFICLI